MKLDLPEWYVDALEELQGIRSAKILTGIVLLAALFAHGAERGVRVHSVLDDGNLDHGSVDLALEECRGRTGKWTPSNHAEVAFFTHFADLTPTERRLVLDLYGKNCAPSPQDPGF